MSRKLDALFAERVMGCKPKRKKERNLVGEGPLWHCQCWPSRPHERHVEGCHDDVTELAFYTHSLDAAWEGVGKLVGLGARFMFQLEADRDTAGAELHEGMVPIAIAGCDKPTPALAVVKACLLAVGVTEEEIRKAEEEP